MSNTVLIVEDDHRLQQVLKDELEDHNFETQCASTLDEAKDILQKQDIEVLLTDIRLPDGKGPELIPLCEQLPLKPSVIVMTAFGTIAQAVEALKQGASDFLTKPLNLEHLCLSIDKIFEQRKLIEEVQFHRKLIGDEHFHHMMGRSSIILKTFEQIKAVAKTRSPVLILGESGVGKELVARAIHAENREGKTPFVAINCAEIPSELLESELFGHSEGAFTGANRNQEGLILQAEGGTLFLDEIGELPMAMQSKLLRFLEDQTVRPLGGKRVRKIDVKIVVATNRELEREVQEGGFREDLYYRLEALSLLVPPLRDRTEDLEILTQHFFQSFKKRYEKPKLEIGHDFLEGMRSHDFPGNIRELKNMIERAVVLNQTGRLGQADLPERLGSFKPGPSQEMSPHDLSKFSQQDGVLMSLSELESKYIRYVLERVEGNKRRAAALLRIGRKTLYRKLEENMN